MKFNKFTFVELLTIVLVIGILVSIIIPNLWKFKSREFISEGKRNATTLSSAVKQYVLSEPDYPTYDGKKPDIGEFKLLDVSKLKPKYLKGNYFNKDFIWIVDNKLVVYPMSLDLENSITIVDNVIQLKQIKSIHTFQIVEVNSKGEILQVLETLDIDNSLKEGMDLNSFETGHKDTYAALIIKDEYGFSTPAIFTPLEEQIHKDISSREETPSIELEDDLRVRQSHSIKVQFHNPEHISRIEYSISENPNPDSKIWIPISNNQIINLDSLNGLYYIHIRAVDKNNGSHYFSTKRHLDNKPPEILMAEDPHSNAEHNVLVEVEDDTYVDSIDYQWTTTINTPASNWIPLPESKIVSASNYNGTMYLHVRAVDSAGNISHKYEKRIFDSSLASIEIDEDYVYRERHNVRIRVRQSYLTIRRVEYAWSNSKTAPSNMQRFIGYTLDTTRYAGEGGTPLYGPYYLHIKVTYWNGQTSQKYIVKYFDGIEPKVNLEKNTAYAKSHSILLAATDNHKVDYVEYVWSNSYIIPSRGWIKGIPNTYIQADGLTGTYVLHVRAYDTAGNVDYDSTVRYFDNTNPTISFSASNYTLSTHSVKINVDDKHSGLSKVEYQWTNTSSTPSSGWIDTHNARTFTKSSGKGTMYFHVKATDSVGNVVYGYVSCKFK